MTFLLPKEEGLSGFSKSFAFLNSHPEYFSTFLNAPEIEIPVCFFIFFIFFFSNYPN